MQDGNDDLIESLEIDDMHVHKSGDYQLIKAGAFCIVVNADNYNGGHGVLFAGNERDADMYFKGLIARDNH